MQKKTLLALALLCAAPPARADILIPGGGASNITIGSTTVTGTAGLLYSDGTYVQSLPGTFYATDPNWTYSQGSVFAFGNDQSLTLTTDKTLRHRAADDHQHQHNRRHRKLGRNLQLYWWSSKCCRLFRQWRRFLFAAVIYGVRACGGNVATSDNYRPYELRARYVCLLRGRDGSVLHRSQ